MTTPFTFPDAVEAARHGESLSKAVERLFSELAPSERLSLLDGDDPFYQGLPKITFDRYNRVPFVMGEVPRLGIPGVRFTDGPRGIVMGSSTAFPVSMARGATWDVSLEERVGNAIGLEGRAQEANYFAGVCVNLPRHPAWGRAQETYGEDPILLGEFGLALTKGVQRHMMACVKHYALNSMENARFKVDVSVDEDVLHEVYLAHFRRIIQGGVASVMSSYNSVNGEWAGQNRHLLLDILRDQYGFDGFVMSDFMFGLRDAVLSVKNGLDIEAPFRQQRAVHLKKALEDGKLDPADVDEACRRILFKELEFAAKIQGPLPAGSVVFCNEHRALAREVAARSAVLLKNDSVNGAPILPLDAAQLSKVAVIGRLANVPNTGDKGSSQVYSPHVVTPFEGIKEALPHAEIILEDSMAMEKAREVASQVDVALCVVGYDSTDEGEFAFPPYKDDPSLLNVFPPPVTQEDRAFAAKMKGMADSMDSGTRSGIGQGGDRNSLRLHAEDVALIRTVKSANPKTIVAVVAGSAVIMEEWQEQVPAILMSWYAGSEGGHGLSDVLLGRVDASGRLPFSVPKDESHLPYFDKDASKIKYDRWFGQALLDKLSVEPAFPLGFGLSYTTFSTSELRTRASDAIDGGEEVLVSFKVTNTGSHDGRYVAQVYGLPGLPDFPKRVLMGFSAVDLTVEETKIVTIDASLRPLQRWVNGAFLSRTGDFLIEVAAFAGDPKALKTEVQLRRIELS